MSINVELHKAAIWAELSLIARDSRLTLREAYRAKNNYVSEAQSSAPPDEDAVLVSRDEAGEALGALSLQRRDGYLYLYKLGVRTTARRQGHARALIEHASRVAREWGFERLQVRTIETTGNVKVFESLGFRVLDRYVSKDFVSPRGQSVIEVRLERLTSGIE